MSEKLIFITNDDGIDAPGINTLISIAKEFGKIIVVTPDGEKSGMSHAVTVKNPLRIKKHIMKDDYELYISNGTPVDCVKLAMHRLLNKKPDLLLSGINHGANSSVNIFYSGTMAAVIEGCMLQIPSIGFSSLHNSYDFDMSVYEKDIKHLISKI